MRSGLPKKSISVIRLQLVREGDLPYSQKPVKSSADAAAILRSFLVGADREYFVVLLLDGRHKIHALNVVSVGTLTSSIVHAREVFKPAILTNSAAMILGHNHPSGDPSPSSEDTELTRRIVEAGELLGIKVLDHVIVGDDRHASFCDLGLI
jgi:DNA repair protein RadC